MAQFPALRPTTRSYNPGDWPVKTWRAMNGSEVRILYGNTRSGSTLDLTFENIPDSTAQQILDHYKQELGTFQTFDLSETTKHSGWGGAADAFNAGVGVQYRYSDAPKITNVVRGRSTVSVTLVGVMV
jgi:hypothetical protein